MSIARNSNMAIDMSSHTNATSVDLTSVSSSPLSSCASSGSDLVPVITLDGPSSSGKGTIGKLLADKLGWHFLDSGILYRVLAWASLQARITANYIDALALLVARLAAQIQIVDVDSVKNAKLAQTSQRLQSKPLSQPQRVIYCGQDITEAIREERCGVRASEIAVIPEVRSALLASYRALRRAPGLVADGRDMGTVVFPDAILKVFLTASATVRAERRLQQLQKKGINASLRAITADLEERDRRDSERAVAPLQAAADAMFIDTTNLSIDEVVQAVFKRVPYLR
jgi:CMP/dCMP kinase